jgi:hypothetical protein
LNIGHVGEKLCIDKDTRHNFPIFGSIFFPQVVESLISIYSTGSTYSCLKLVFCRSMSFSSFFDRFKNKNKYKPNTTMPRKNQRTNNNNSPEQEASSYVKEKQKQLLTDAVDRMIDKTKQNYGRLPHGEIRKILLD